MIRSLFRFVAAVSTLLFVATLVLWVRGQRRMDHFWLIHGDKGSELIRSSEGRIALRHSRPNGRSRITLPKRVSHWSCRVGSQLPPGKSPLHWRWRFITYEGTPEATELEVRSAHLAIQNAAKVRAGLGVTDAEWDAPRRPSSTVLMNGLLNARQTLILQTKRSDQQARDLLAGTSYWEWSVPVWIPALVTAVPPTLWIAGWHRRRRIRLQGRCPNCGYDLRASPDRCPECGLTFAPSKGRRNRPPDGAEASSPFAAQSTHPPAQGVIVTVASSAVSVRTPSSNCTAGPSA